MADVTGAVIQLDWASVSAVAVPISTAIGAAAKFGWSALFGYIGDREKLHEQRNNAVTDKLADLGEALTALCSRIEGIDAANRAEAGKVNDRLITALVANTVSNERVCESNRQLAAMLADRPQRSGAGACDVAQK